MKNISITFGLILGVVLNDNEKSLGEGCPFDVIAKIKKRMRESYAWGDVQELEETSAAGHYVTGNLRYVTGATYSFHCGGNCIPTEAGEPMSFEVHILRTDRQEIPYFELTAIKHAVEKLLSS